MYIDTEEIAQYIIDMLGEDALDKETVAEIIAGDSEGFIEDITDNVYNDIKNLMEE